MDRVKRKPHISWKILPTKGFGRTGDVHREALTGNGTGKRTARENYANT